MSTAAHGATLLCASMLAADTLDDERFYEATALLATRFDHGSELGDLRSDEAAPQLLFDWLRHAEARVPALRVWDLTCQINAFFHPDFGLHLPHEWPWDTRERVLQQVAQLRARPEWMAVFAQALLAPSAASLRAIACCAAERLGVDPYPAVWSYLCEHADDGYAWFLVAPCIDEARLPTYLAIARMLLLTPALPPLEPWMTTACDAHWRVWWEVLGVLQRFPGRGIDLLEAGIRVCDAGVRRQAIEALAANRYAGLLPPDSLTLLRELVHDEPDEGVRWHLLRLLE